MSNDKETIQLPIRDYLGDGIYVAFNGYSYEISVNHHNNPTVVTFEAEHIDAFLRFKNRMNQLIQSHNKE